MFVTNVYQKIIHENLGREKKIIYHVLPKSTTIEPLMFSKFSIIPIIRTLLQMQMYGGLHVFSP